MLDVPTTVLIQSSAARHCLIPTNRSTAFSMLVAIACANLHLCCLSSSWPLREIYERSQPIVDLLPYARRLECTVPRDQLIALPGMASDIIEGPKSDYSLRTCVPDLFDGHDEEWRESFIMTCQAI